MKIKVRKLLSLPRASFTILFFVLISHNTTNFNAFLMKKFSILRKQQQQWDCVKIEYIREQREVKVMSSKNDFTENYDNGLSDKNLVIINIIKWRWNFDWKAIKI